MSELDVRVLDLLRHPGERHHVEATVDLSEVDTTSARVTDRPAEVALDLEAQGRQVMVHGHLTFEWEGACRRCLEPTRQVETAELQEVFEASPVEGETWLLDGDHIDLGPAVRQAASLALPLAPLCRVDCAGPDPEHYPAVGDDGQAATAGADTEPPVDPRWSPLDELRFDQE